MARVIINRAALKREFRDNDLSRQARILRLLKDDGIPVVGVTGIEGVSSGTLTITFDEVFDEMIYEWTP